MLFCALLEENIVGMQVDDVRAMGIMLKEAMSEGVKIRILERDNPIRPCERSRGEQKKLKIRVMLTDRWRYSAPNGLPSMRNTNQSRRGGLKCGELWCCCMDPFLLVLSETDGWGGRRHERGHDNETFCSHRTRYVAPSCRCSRHMCISVMSLDLF